MSSCINKIAVFKNLFALICSQPRDKQNRARDFFLFIYFLQLISCKKKLVELLQLKMNDSLLEKIYGYIFVQHLIENGCAKFKVDRLSHLCTGVRQVFNLTLAKFL